MKRYFPENRQEEEEEPEEPRASTSTTSDAPVSQQLDAADEDRASAILIDDEDRTATIVHDTDEASTILNPSEIFSDRPDLLCKYNHRAVIK